MTEDESFKQPEQFAANPNQTLSNELYTKFHQENDRALHIGLYGEDLENAQTDPRTVRLTYSDEGGTEVTMPVMVPIDSLQWYNLHLFKQKFGEDARGMVYVHPPVTSPQAQQEAQDILHKNLEEGVVIVADKYTDDEESPIARLLLEGQDNHDLRVSLFGGEVSSRVDFYDGLVKVRDSDGIKYAPSFEEAYEEAIANDEVERNLENGPSLASIIEGEEAEAIWGIYDKPFEDLGGDDPVFAGFSKEELMDILKDPDTVKIVNRVDSEITTLLFFLHDFNKAPWFNEQVYKAKYPELFDTKNILIFPGIVTDEEKRGNDYATQVVDFATFLANKRQTDLLITFECTQISSTYIPQLVEASINHSGVAKIEGLEHPTGSLSYFAIQKS